MKKKYKIKNIATEAGYQDEVQFIYDLYIQHFNITKISKILRCSNDTIRFYLKKKGVEFKQGGHNRKITYEVLAKYGFKTQKYLILHFLGKGYTSKEIAEELNMSVVNAMKLKRQYAPKTKKKQNNKEYLCVIYDKLKNCFFAKYNKNYPKLFPVAYATAKEAAVAYNNLVLSYGNDNDLVNIIDKPGETRHAYIERIMTNEDDFTSDCLDILVSHGLKI